jgi:hypothetical protein
MSLLPQRLPLSRLTQPLKGIKLRFGFNACMSSKGTIKWLTRLNEPRTIESLLSEVYGEAVWFGCLFEREVADLLNFYELLKTFCEFNTEDWTLNALIKEVENRKFLPEEQLSTLRDAKNQSDRTSASLGMTLMVCLTKLFIM